MKHLIICGAYGLIGSTICKQLEQYPVKVTKIKCDELPLNLSQADYIIYGVGYGQPQMFSKDKLRTIEINTSSLRTMFDYLKPDGKFLYISSSEVYSGAESPYKETDIGTTTPQHPRACYIEGKRCGEAICMAYKEAGLDVKIARLSLAYGAAKRGDTRVLNQFIEQGFTGNITLKDAGTALRTYCYVDDAVDMMLKILFYGKDVVYNVGGFSTITIANLALEIGRIMKATVTIPEEDQGLKDAPQDVKLDMTKTLTEFEQNFTPLDRGLKIIIKKYGHIPHQ